MKASLVKESPWYQLLITLLLAVVGTIVLLVLGLLLIPLFFSVGFQEIFEITSSASSADSPDIFKFLQVFNTIGTFLFPGILGAYLFSKHPVSFLKLNSFPSNSFLVVVLLIIVSLSGMAISDLLYRFSTAIPFPEILLELQESFVKGQELMEKQIKSFLQMESFLDFAGVFLVLAILPAICEEVLFRGILQPLFIKVLKNVHLGILSTSIFFGILHQQFFSFLSIVALSMALGYLKYWSRSLWIPIIMHLINNGSIVVAVYYFNMPVNEVQNSAEAFDPWQFWVSILFFSAGLILLYRIFQKRNSFQGIKKGY